ncbi:MAG TPA: acyl-CoA dehydrogenase family protein [Acidimicrobiales bacterium]|nr:acyl-CoA dehydrogenase family protein [Acidimicrobiales bacterium]
MDVRLSAEQVALRDAAAQLANRLGPKTVAELEDTERIAKLEAAVAASGWRELRPPDDDGTPLASAVEVAVVAEELGRGLVDASFLGPTLAADLRRRAGAPTVERSETVALAGDLSGPLVGPGTAAGSAIAPDAAGCLTALALIPDDGAFQLGSLALGRSVEGVDLTRPSGTCEGTATPLDGQSRSLGEDDLAAWRSLALAASCADLVGVMRGALTLTSDYARSRRQYGAAIGSFQAVQHLLADALVAVEGSRSVALHAAWAVDALEGEAALVAASAAKAYCARAARSVCETAIQVHGGIGNTWECLAHVFLRRALLSSELLGGVGANLDRVLAANGIGGDNGLR